MAELHEYIEAELENIDRVVSELPDSDSLAKLSALELAGVGALVHNFYNGIENILKQMIISTGSQLPTGSSSHRDIVNTATSCNIISQGTANELRRFLAFRHFFSHGYSFDLDKERIIPLVKDIPKTLDLFRSDISKAL